MIERSHRDLILGIVLELIQDIVSLVFGLDALDAGLGQCVSRVGDVSVYYLVA